MTIIAIDFDGTCVTHEYPDVGKDIGAAPVLRKLVERGDKLVLYTMRSGVTLQDAVQWFATNEIKLWGVNQNPEQHTWTQSPKIYAQIYIDDAALGVPLVRPLNGKRPYVDWGAVADMIGTNLPAKEH